MSTRAVVDLLIVFGVPIVGTGLWLLGVLTADAARNRWHRRIYRAEQRRARNGHMPAISVRFTGEGPRYTVKCACGWHADRPTVAPETAHQLWREHFHV